MEQTIDPDLGIFTKPALAGFSFLWYSIFMEEELQKKIEAVFVSAGLSEMDKCLWLSRLSLAGERAQRVFVEAFSEDSEMLVFFTRDLRNRIEAGDDPQKLAPILEEEKGYFKDLLSAKI